MEFNVEIIASADAQAECLLVSSYYQKQDEQDEKSVSLSSYGNALDKQTDGLLSQLIEQKQLTGCNGQVDLLHKPYGAKADQVAILGLGEKCDYDTLCTALASAYNFFNQRHIETISLNLADLIEVSGVDAANAARAVSQTLHDAFYRYDQTLSKKTDAPSLNTIKIIIPHDIEPSTVERSIAVGQAVGKAMSLSKTLSNLPGNICTPTYLANKANELQKSTDISTTVLDESKMKKLKMNALLSVSKGSREPAKLIIMEYKNAAKSVKPVVLVGKGLTFDAGGISLKPSASMDEMKYDMCGGASVIGTMQAIAELALPINVVGIVASSENLPDGAANKPGDIVESMSGTTIEILNTDAEGRLILCDALTYAERFSPAAVIDIATLTGACMVALGKHTSGLFSNDDDLAEQLLNAGETAHDRAWRLPIWDVYQPQLKSNFADVANIGGRFAGAITAACFLKRFAENYKWAHLDIAGTAWNSGANKGATGRPIAMLVEFLSHYNPKDDNA